jgi:ribonuclease P protein subunit POP4
MIDCNGRKKTLPKDSIVLELTLPGGCRVRVEGIVLLSRPEDRIKKKHRIKFA